MEERLEVGLGSLDQQQTLAEEAEGHMEETQVEQQTLPLLDLLVGN
jgi:hypothetical protein